MLEGKTGQKEENLTRHTFGYLGYGGFEDSEAEVRAIEGGANGCFLGKPDWILPRSSMISPRSVLAGSALGFDRSIHATR